MITTWLPARSPRSAWRCRHTESRAPAAVRVRVKVRVKVRVRVGVRVRVRVNPRPGPAEEQHAQHLCAGLGTDWVHAGTGSAPLDAAAEFGSTKPADHVGAFPGRDWVELEWLT